MQDLLFYIIQDRIFHSFFTLRAIFKNSLKIARVFSRMQFERIFKCHERYKPLFSRAFAGLRIHYHRTGKISNGANYVQIKNK